MNAEKSFWPYGIILTFVLFVSGIATLVVIACTHKTDLITANYYDDEIRFQSRLDQINRTAQLAGEVTVTYDAIAQSINIALPRAQSAAAVTGRIQLYRPSATELDRTVPLQLDAQGAQVLDAAALLPGLWKVRVQWTVEDHEYFADKSVVVKRGV